MAYSQSPRLFEPGISDHSQWISQTPSAVISAHLDAALGLGHQDACSGLDYLDSKLDLA